MRLQRSKEELLRSKMPPTAEAHPQPLQNPRRGKMAIVEPEKAGCTKTRSVQITTGIPAQSLPSVESIRGTTRTALSTGNRTARVRRAVTGSSL